MIVQPGRASKERSFKLHIEPVMQKRVSERGTASAKAQGWERGWCVGGTGTGGRVVGGQGKQTLGASQSEEMPAKWLWDQ